MLGIFLSLCAAILDSFKNVFMKKTLKDISVYSIAWIFRTVPLIVFVPALFIMGIPNIETGFWTALIFSGILNVVGTILFVKSIKKTDISVAIPLLSFTPVFLIFTSFLMLNELPNLLGIAGILLIFAGSYSLNLKKDFHGFFYPFKEILRNPGAVLMLATAFIWSLTANFDKIGITQSSPFFWGVLIHIFISIGLLPFLFKNGYSIEKIKRKWLLILGIGIFPGIGLLCQYIALELTLVPYVISIKRTTILFSVIFGGVFLKEKHMKKRILSALLMLLGISLITLSFI